MSFGRISQTTLVIAQGGDPGALNPAVTTSGNTHPVTDQIFNGLVGLDAELNPVPALAEQWRIEDDGRTYRFTLRDGVRWHDGTPFTSGDVKFTFENALLKYHSRTRAALEGLLLGIDTPDQRTAIFRMKRPYSPLLQRLDQALWVAEQLDFVPHVLLRPGAALPAEPVRERTVLWLLAEPQPALGCDTAINLGRDDLELAQAQQRVAEVVSTEPADMAAGRARWKRYEAAGDRLQHHPQR